MHEFPTPKESCIKIPHKCVNIDAGCQVIAYTGLTGLCTVHMHLKLYTVKKSKDTNTEDAHDLQKLMSVKMC